MLQFTEISSLLIAYKYYATKGVIIFSINFSLRGFVPPFDVDNEPEQSVQSEAEFAPPKLTEMYSVTAALLPLFKPCGYR